MLSKASEYDIYSNTYSAVNIKELVVKELTDNMEDYDGFITNEGNEERGADTVHETYFDFVRQVGKVSSTVGRNTVSLTELILRTKIHFLFFLRWSS